MSQQRPTAGRRSMNAGAHGDKPVARVLVVEDSRTQADWMRMLLAREGHDVTVAGDGQEAVDVASKRDFDIVLADVDMPRIDGFELCRRMKADGRLRAIPFVMVTQHDRVTDLIRALEVGADNFLTKPLDPGATVARVERILNEVQAWRTRAATRRHRIGLPTDEVVLSFERAQLVEMLMSSAEELETELDTVEELGLALLTTHQLDAVLGLLAARARELSQADAVAVALYDADDGTWQLPEVAMADGAAREQLIGRRYGGLPPASLEKLARREFVRMAPHERAHGELATIFGEPRSGDLYVFGMCAAEQIVGAILLSFPRSRGLTVNERRRFQHLANQGAVAIESARLFEDERDLRIRLGAAYDEVKAAHKNAMFMLAAAVEARDGLTGSHLRRVQSYAEAIGRTLGLPEAALDELAYSCVMHDVGKLLVPDAILGKPGKLTDEEWVEMRRHPEYGAQILGDREFFRMAREIAHCHHERWDGTGYPRGLKGEAIPIAARITSVADVFDALTTRRSYKEAWSDDAALAELKRLSGTAFDPSVVEAFLEMWRSGEVDRIRSRVADGSNGSQPRAQ